MKHLVVKSLCLFSLSSSAFCLNLPNKTPKDPEFKPAGADLAADKDFAGPAGQAQYREIAMEVRKDPKQADVMAVKLATGEGENPSEHRAIEHYVATELKKEALARQYVLLIDKSGSMGTRDQDGGARGTRWGAAQKATEMLIGKMFEYDMDHKVPVYLFGDKIETIGELTDVKQVMQLFDQHYPDGGSTNLAGALTTALADHLGKARDNYKVVPGTTVVVITDGQPDSESAVEDILKHYADPKSKFIANDEELAVSFIQIGDDKGATTFLERMDKGFMFEGRKMDICDTKKDNFLWDQKGGVEKILADAIFD